LPIANTPAYPIAWVICDEEKTVLIKLTPDGNPSNARNLKKEKKNIFRLFKILTNNQFLYPSFCSQISMPHYIAQID
jgi:hypothetical protein